MKRLAFMVTVAALATGPAHAGDTVLFGPPPAWVVEHPLAAAPAEDSGLPVQYLQIDNQVHVEGGTTTTYSRLQVKFLASQGLSAGNLTYSWKPETDALTVHKVVLHRGDQTIDVLGKGQTFTILRREQNLEQATLTGMLTANLFPEGLQVGDVLETEISLASTNPVTGDHAEELFGPLNFPAGRIDVSIEWPRDKAMRLTRSDDLPEWQRGQRGGFQTATISLENVEPVVPPRGAPTRYGIPRVAEATDFKSWGEVADLFVPLYKKASQIPAQGPLRDELEKIRAASNDPVKRTEAALALVEEQVRYVALTMGAGGLVPADAEQTWSRRYGDCKAKTALLLGLLGELGIEAEPVTVNSSLGDSIDGRLPAVGLFDHILVRATIAGKTYWLDGTRSGDTSLARLTVPDFGWGLPIAKRVTGLVRMVPSPLDVPDSDLSLDLDASKGIRGDVPVQAEMILRGDTAIGTNQVLTSLAGNARDRALREYWRGKFDFITPDKLDSSYDPQTGELRLTEHGTAKMDWDNGWYELDDMTVGYKADFSRAPGPGSDAPFAIGYPYYEHTRETILLPPGFTRDAISGTTEVDETVGGIEYKRHADMTGNRFTIERRERSLVPELPYKDAVAAEKRLRALRDERVFLRVPNDFPLTEADLAVAMAETPDDPEKLVTLGNSLLGVGKASEALVRFTRATELDPRSAGAWAGRGLAEARTGQLNDASASFDKAEAIDPRNLGMLNGRGMIDEQRNDFQAAVDDFDAVLKLYPDNAFAASHRVSALVATGRPTEAMAAIDRLLADNPKDISSYSMKSYLLMRQGDRAGAEKAIDAMVAANPGNDWATHMAVQLYSDYGMTDKAGALVHSANAGEPTALSLYNEARVRDPSDKEGKLADLDASVRLDPQFVPARVLRAQVRDALGRPEDALADVNEALRLVPEYDQALRERAHLLASLGRREEALEDVDKLIAKVPEDIDSYLLKANLLRALGRKDATLQVASDLTAANPEETGAHVTAAKIFDAFGERDKALAEFDKALAIKPDAYIYINRAQVRPLADFAAQMADAERALALEPKMPEALALKADILGRQGDHAGAAELYSQAFAVEPDNPGYLVERGIERWRAGQHDAAQADFTAAHAKADGAMSLNNLCYQKAAAGIGLELALAECQESLRLLPDMAPTLDSLATVYLQMGRWQEAKDNFDRVLEKSPEMAPSLLGRAIARLKLGDAAGARADAAAARKISPAIAERFAAQGIPVPGELAD